MEFLHPNFLYLLVVLVLLSIFKKFHSSNKTASFQVSNTKQLKSFFGAYGSFKIGFFRFLFITSLVCFIIAIARPRISTNDKEITIEVIDIMLVLDTSSSMLAEDFKPNRLEAVKQAANDFIDNRKGDRIGLLVFGKETFIQCPLTVDYAVLSSLLSEVTVVEPKYDGTAIGIAIANAVNRLRSNDSKSKVIILLSDGSNNSGAIDPIAAAKIAACIGASIIEKHVTLDKTSKGTDHKCSCEFDDLRNLNHFIKNIPIYLGNSSKKIEMRIKYNLQNLYDDLKAGKRKLEF